MRLLDVLELTFRGMVLVSDEMAKSITQNIDILHAWVIYRLIVYKLYIIYNLYTIVIYI